MVNYKRLSGLTNRYVMRMGLMYLFGGSLEIIQGLIMIATLGSLYPNWVLKFELWLLGIKEE